MTTSMFHETYLCTKYKKEVCGLMKNVLRNFSRFTFLKKIKVKHYLKDIRKCSLLCDSSWTTIIFIYFKFYSKNISSINTLVMKFKVLITYKLILKICCIT